MAGRRRVLEEDPRSEVSSRGRSMDLVMTTASEQVGRWLILRDSRSEAVWGAVSEGVAEAVPLAMEGVVEEQQRVAPLYVHRCHLPRLPRPAQ